jgi:hypothetical protein
MYKEETNNSKNVTLFKIPHTCHSIDCFLAGREMEYSLRFLDKFIGLEYRSPFLLHAWCRSGADLIEKHGKHGYYGRIALILWDKMGVAPPYVRDRHCRVHLWIRWLRVRPPSGTLTHWISLSTDPLNFGGLRLTSWGF